MDYEAILATVADYKEFLTLKELDERVEQAKTHFSVEQVGLSEQKHPIYLITAGKGKRKVFLWGFPHPNEPIGSLAIDSLLEYFKANPQELEQSGCTWYFIYTADPDGTKLNEDWFKGTLTPEKYFNNFYRPPANRMIDWTFPITYKEATWNTPLPETQVIMNVLERIRPDVMYPLHNSGFGGAYFLTTEPFSHKYYETIRTKAKQLGIPLHLGEPEEPFMNEIEKPFYLIFGFKDYYDYGKKVGNPPLQHGENSANYLIASNPEAISIIGEVPYFLTKEIDNTLISKKTRKESWTEFLTATANNLESVQPIIQKVIEKIKAPNPWYYVLASYQKRWESRSSTLLENIQKDPEYDRQVSSAEAFSAIFSAQFYHGGLLFGQVKRAAKEAGLSEDIQQELTSKIAAASSVINKLGWSTLPIRNAVQMQLALLFETLHYIDNKTEEIK